MMTKEQLAAQLDGREMLQEISRSEQEAARKAGLVVAFGYSDDNVELRGAIDAEVDALNGTTLYLNSLGHYSEDPALADAHALKAVWCGDCGHSWSFETAIPHATFTVMEKGERFCRGIVFALADLARQSTTAQQSLSQGAGYLRLCAHLLLQMAEERGLDLGDEAAVMTLQVDGREQTAPLTYVIGRMNALARELSAMAEGRLA